MNPAKAKLLSKQSKAIPGWFSTDASMLFAWIDEIQKRNNIEGDCFEIGCHHGKSAVLLASMVKPGKEKLAVCDLFGMQSDNVSRSGNGDLDAFNRNMQPIRDSGVGINIFQKNSATLTASEIGQTYRIFHVDGGHNPDEALIDLRLAAECTIESGAIILDDPSSQRDTFGFSYPWRVKEMPFHGTVLRVFYVPDYLQRKSLGNLARWVYNKSDLLASSREKRASVKAIRS